MSSSQSQMYLLGKASLFYQGNTTTAILERSRSIKEEISLLEYFHIQDILQYVTPPLNTRSLCVCVHLFAFLGH